MSAPLISNPTPRAPLDHFDALFTADEDPWQYRTRWYEQRKRDLLLACLPERRFADAFEPACANGELTAALAGRCDRLLATDASLAAVAIARRRLADRPHVAVEHAVLPDDWPEDRPGGRFDLIVLSDFGYYLSPPELQRVIDRTGAALRAGGVCVACHWRHPEADYLRSGDEVQHTIRTGMCEAHALARLVRHEEDDVLLEVWSRDARSVARREGLRP